MPTKCSMKALNPIISTTGNDLMASESREDEGESIDRISMLPDDILGCILSNLSFKEATATSILSRRWRYSWTFTRKLDFNGWKALERVRNVKNWRKKWRSELEKERVKYIRWVNNVIASCNNTCIEEFKVYFNLDRTHQTCIDEWVRYALSRKIETLELDVPTEGHGGDRNWDECYTFPCDILGQYELDKLRIIRTYDVNVSDEAVQLFLHNCPLLEELSVSYSGYLVDLRIMGPFPSLKHLKIEFCDNMKSVEVRDVDLVCLEYDFSDEPVDFVLVNAPRLVNLGIGDDLAMFSSYLPQLEVLTHDIIGFRFEETQTEVLDAMAKMRNLKELRVTVFVGGDESLLPLTHFLCALPCLESFGVLVRHRDPKFISTLETKLEKVSGSYPHLKEVTFLDYYGAKCDLELIAHFLENGKVLEDIVVHTRLSTWDPIPWMWRHNPSNKERKKLNRVEKQIQKLAPPPIINLSIF